MFKVGDKVRVIGFDLEEIPHTDPYWEFVGKKGIIIFYREYYHVLFSDSYIKYLFKENEIELVGQEQEQLVLFEL